MLTFDPAPPHIVHPRITFRIGSCCVAGNVEIAKPRPSQEGQVSFVFGMIGSGKDLPT
jgi:hypothetical protein